MCVLYLFVCVYLSIFIPASVPAQVAAPRSMDAPDGMREVWSKVYWYLLIYPHERADINVYYNQFNSFASLEE